MQQKCVYCIIICQLEAEGRSWTDGVLASTSLTDTRGRDHGLDHRLAVRDRFPGLALAFLPFFLFLQHLCLLLSRTCVVGTT